jgi:hypothetical protein
MTDRDCNTGNKTADWVNKCLNLDSLKENPIQSGQDFENVMRIFQTLYVKDESMLVKYNQIANMMKHFSDKTFLRKVGVCICNSSKCLTNRGIISMPNKPCNPSTSLYKPRQFGLTSKYTNSKTGLKFKSYYCECKSKRMVGLNCEYEANQCNFTLSIESLRSKTLGSLFNNSMKCVNDVRMNMRTHGFCYPLLRSQNRSEVR